MPKPIRSLLIEDNPDYRGVIELALQGSEEVELLGVFGTAEMALRSIGDGRIAMPDLVLLDLRLPGMGGLNALPELKRLVPAAAVVILTQSNREADVLEAIGAGASGYLLKSATLDEIRAAIRSVAAGGVSLDPKVARYVLDRIQQPASSGADSIALSKRELQVLELLAEGKVKKEIASELAVGFGTVDTHMRHIYEKLQVGNAAAAISKAHRQGILE